jgi:hypothetical protein
MHFRTRIEELEEDVKEVQQWEQEEKQLRAAENQSNKAKRLLEAGSGADDKRQWFQTHKQRLQEKGWYREPVAQWW